MWGNGFGGLDALLLQKAKESKVNPGTNQLIALFRTLRENERSEALPNWASTIRGALDQFRLVQAADGLCNTLYFSFDFLELLPTRGLH